jgi:hypothetical protein
VFLCFVPLVNAVDEERRRLFPLLVLLVCLFLSLDVLLSFPYHLFASTQFCNFCTVLCFLGLFLLLLKDVPGFFCCLWLGYCSCCSSSCWWCSEKRSGGGGGEEAAWTGAALSQPEDFLKSLREGGGGKGLESGDRERGVAMGAGYGLLVALYTLVSAGGIAWRINSALRNDFWRGGGGGGALDPVEAARVLQSLLQSSFTLALLGNLLLAFFLLITLCVKVRLSNPVSKECF